MARFQIDPSPAQLAGLRDRVRLMPELTDVEHSTTDDIVLVVSELVSNAVAAADRGTKIRVTVDREPGAVVVAVENSGPPFEHHRAELPPLSAMRGRGLAIVSVLSDGLEVRCADGQTRVEARCPISRAQVPSHC